MSLEFDSYQNPKEGKTYISPPIKNQFGEGSTIRIVTRGFDSEESYEMTKIKDEILLRQTTGGKNIITAKVFEKSGNIHVLNIQQYTAETGSPHKLGFAFIGDEITKLFNFIKDVQIMRFGSERFQRLFDEDIEHIAFTDSQAKQIIRENPELFASVLRAEITSEDVVAIGYRKKQIEVFEKLLNDSSYFQDIKNKKHCQNESLWQQFFEKNQWIFGYGLGYVFLTGLDDKKLEQVVEGYDVGNRGKRVDALMKTRGLISNLCFVEIKTHSTELLDDAAYRAGCFAPSKELSGAIAQMQGSVAVAVKNLSNKLSVTDDGGNPTGEEIYNYQPKSFLVIGSLNEFNTTNGVNAEKLRSFELFRRNLIQPEIITFDELYERAKFITNYNENNSRKEGI